MKKMKIRVSVSVLLAAGLLSACSLIPTYERPAAPVAAAFPAEPVPAAANQTGITADSGWREFFQDARLQALIAGALENNRDLRVAALRIEEARAQYNVVRADLLPNLNAVAGGSRGRTSADTSPTGTAITATSYQVGLSLASYELDFFGRVRSLNAAALASYLATEEAQRSAQISLVAQVANAYFAERAYAEQEELARRTLNSRVEGLKLAQQRFDVGASSALDLRSTEVLVETARTSLATQIRQRAQAVNALTLLVGRPLGELPPAPLLSEQNLVAELPAGLPSDLLIRRPDIRGSEQQLIAANANIGAARAAFFPRISLTASAGSTSSDLDNLFNSATRTWSFAPQLTLPIFDAGRNSANLSLSEIRKNIAVASYERTVQTAFQEVSDALVARGAIDEQIEAQRRVLVAQTDRLRLAQQRYQNGIASSLDVLDAEREQFSAEQSLVQARLLRLTNAVDLYRSLGGGLKEKSAS